MTISRAGNPHGQPGGSRSFSAARWSSPGIGCPDCHAAVTLTGEGYLEGRGRDEDAIPRIQGLAAELTPENATGLDRFTERQIFNSLRYGLQQGETPDVEITSTAPGEGNFSRCIRNTHRRRWCLSPFPTYL